MEPSAVGGQLLALSSSLARPSALADHPPIGQIQIPGIPAGISAEGILPVMQLYTAVLEANRILDRVRPRLAQTPPAGPQDPLTPLTASPHWPGLFYKREDATITRAYKVRGAVVGMAKHLEADPTRGFLAVSTGNHALGVLHAAALLRPGSVRLVVPTGLTPWKAQRIHDKIQVLKELGVSAQCVAVGDTFDSARAWAMAHQAPDETYLDPYADPWVVAGQGTIGFELAQQLRDALRQAATLGQTLPREITVVAPVGGGGLLAGTATALHLAAAWDPAFRSVALRCVGLRLSEPEAPLGDAIRVAKLAPFNQQVLDTLQVQLVGMDQSVMASGQAQVQADLGLLVEGASAGAVHHALTTPTACPSPARWTVCVLSGANIAPSA
jgi:threonine dehydratase